MQRLSPHILASLRRVGEENRHPMNRYWDGYNPGSKEEAQSEESLLFQVSARELSYCGCLRSAFLGELAAHLPEGVTRFGKQVEKIVEDNTSEKVNLHFADGTIAEADIGTPLLTLHIFICLHRL